ncbi:MAG: NAD(P)-binding protein [Opitutaceae bacterium]
MRPIEIVGGGLAGLSLGCALQESGVETTIIEAGTYPRHRVCGEFISGLSPIDRERLTLGPALADARKLSSVSWHRKEREVCRHQLPSPALGISRFTLDARLVERFTAAGGRLRTRTRARTTPGKPGSVWTAGHRTSPSPFIGLKAHFKGLSLATDLEMYLGDQAYVGLSPVENGAANLCGLFRRRSIRGEIPEMINQYLEACGLRGLKSLVARASVVAGSPCAVAGLDYDSSPDNGPGLSLGDARQLIPPFTGAGMATAFAAASEALPSLVAWSRDEIDWPRVDRQIRTRLRLRLNRRLRASRWIHPFLLEPRRQSLTSTLARLHLLPFNLLFHLLH